MEIQRYEKSPIEQFGGHLLEKELACVVLVLSERSDGVADGVVEVWVGAQEGTEQCGDGTRLEEREVREMSR